MTAPTGPDRTGEEREFPFVPSDCQHGSWALHGQTWECQLCGEARRNGAPSPMATLVAEDRTGVVARLDALEAAHKAATPGPWEQDGEYPTEVYNGRVGNSEELIADCHTRADAAAIVAEHNAFGDLLAAVRGVLDRHVPVDARPFRYCRECTGNPGIDRGTARVSWPCSTYRTVAAALGEA